MKSLKFDIKLCYEKIHHTYREGCPIHPGYLLTLHHKDYATILGNTYSKLMFLENIRRLFR